MGYFLKPAHLDSLWSRSLRVTALYAASIFEKSLPGSGRFKMGFLAPFLGALSRGGQSEADNPLQDSFQSSPPLARERCSPSNRVKKLSFLSNPLLHSNVLLFTAEFYNCSFFHVMPVCNSLRFQCYSIR